MKKVLIILVSLVLMISTAACAVDSPAPATTSPVKEPASPSPSPVETVAATTEPPAETASATGAAGGDGLEYSEYGNELMKNEVIGGLKLGMTEGEVAAAIGAAESKTEAEMWGADGKKHLNWNYPAKGLTLNMVEGDKPEAEYALYAISVEAPSDFATSKGIKLGSSKDDVMTAYGQYVEDQSDEATLESIVVGTVFGGLIFGMNNGAVNSIFLGAAAE